MIAVGRRVLTNDQADNGWEHKEGVVFAHKNEGDSAYTYLRFDGVPLYNYAYSTPDGEKAYLAHVTEFEVIEGVPTEDEQDEPLEEWEKELMNPNTTAEDVLDGMTKIAPQHETVQADISPEREERTERMLQRDADTARIYRLIDALGDVSVRNWELVTNNEDTIFLNVTFKRH